MDEGPFVECKAKKNHTNKTALLRSAEMKTIRYAKENNFKTITWKIKGLMVQMS